MYTSEIPVTKKRAQDATAKIEKLRLKRIRRIRHKQQEGPPPSESMGWLIYPRNLFMAIYRGPHNSIYNWVFGPTLWTLLAIAEKSVVFVGCCFFSLGLLGRRNSLAEVWPTQKSMIIFFFIPSDLICDLLLFKLKYHRTW